MMMRTIREKTRWAIVFLAVAFAAWLAFEGIQSRETSAVTGNNPVIGVVNGEQIRFQRWRDASGAQLDQARQIKGGPLTDEEIRQAESEAWELMVRDVIIEQEIERLGIEVTDAEVSQAFRTSPPPFVARSPAFQTDGQFDYAKYQAFFADPSVDERLLLSIEQYYRDQLPRVRFEQQLMSGVAVSDAEAWEAFKAQNETATVSYVRLGASELVPDSLIEVSETDARAYYREHRDDFERPATATVRMVSFSTVPGPQDTARVRDLADSLRAAIVAGETTFEEAAVEYSADSLSAAEGGALGRYLADDLTEPFATTVRELGTGEISEPVSTPNGLHLVRVSERAGDTASVGHIMLPIRLSEDSEDVLFGRMDDVEGVALDDGLQAARDSFNLDVRESVTLTDGFDFVPGAGSLGVGVDWALDDFTLVGDLSEFYENGSGFHLLELVDRTEAGEFSFDEVRAQIETTLRAERRASAARRALQERLDGMAGADLEAIAAALRQEVQTTGPFGRSQFAAGLGRDTEAVGAAFTAPIGDVSGPYSAGDAAVVLRVEERTEADEQLFAVMKNQVRAQVAARTAQQRAADWLAALREEAVVVDHRDRLNQPADAQPVVPPLI